MNTSHIVAIFGILAGIMGIGAVIGAGALLESSGTAKRNPYGEENPITRHFKVHFDTTKFPELPKWAWATKLECYGRNLSEFRAGQAYVILEDGRKITTTYSNIAVEE